MKKRFLVLALIAVAVLGVVAVGAYSSSWCTHNVYVMIPGEGVVFCGEFCRYYDENGDQTSWSCASGNNM